MSRFLSKKYAQLEAYVPGEQPKDKQYIKLNTNESPFQPSAKTVEALNETEIKKLNLYPDPDCRELTIKLAEVYGVKPENIFLTNGSDDILNFFFLIFCDKDHPVVFPEVSYGFYEVYANLYGLNYTMIPMNPDLSINPPDYLGIGKNIVIANPNAQTGTAMPVSAVEEILKTNPGNLVVVDEAYVDFGCESSVGLVQKYDNILVIQTFSKSRCMAGGRLGFAIGSGELIGDLNKIKYSTNPYNINRLTQVAGIAALEDNEYYMEQCKIVMENRSYLVQELHKLGFWCTNSSANFILAKSDAIGGGELYLALKSMGILVRHFENTKISDYVRITIGTKEQMDALIAAVKTILKG